MVRVSVGIYVGLLIPLVYALPRGRVEGRKAEQATECNATWNACDGPCDHLKEVVEYAAHIEFHVSIPYYVWTLEVEHAHGQLFMEENITENCHGSMHRIYRARVRGTDSPCAV